MIIRIMILIALSAFLVPGTATPAQAQTRTPCVVLFIDLKFYGGLETEIQRLAHDIEVDLSTSTLIEVMDVNETSPEAIRAMIQILYRNDGLLGAILMGDIPTLYLGDYPFAPNMATDAFYEDLDDGCWIDPDGNGIYNSVVDDDGDGEYDWFLKTWIGEHNREIWTGRLQPPSSLNLSKRIELLRNYLDRNHRYRIGETSYQRGMVYAESVRHNSDPGDIDDDYDTIHDRAVTMMDESWLFDREAGDVLNFVWSDQLPEHMNLWLKGVHTAYEYGFLNVHGTPTSQWFGGSNWLISQDYLNTPAHALLIDFASCNNGDFTNPDYLAGWALFGGETLAVIANTTVSFYIGNPEPNPDHRLLSLGLTLGETRLATILGGEQSVLLGDPTLRLRESSDGPQVVADTNLIVFPDAYEPNLHEGYTGERKVMLTNLGDRPVRIYYRAMSLASIDGKRPWSNDLQSSFEVRHSWQLFPFTLSPGESRRVPIDFYYDGRSGVGTYRAKFILYTDSPAAPYFWINVEKKLHNDPQ